VRLPRPLADELVAHAREDMPNECCGLIAGRDGAATRVIRTANTDASPFMYVMDPMEQMRLMEEIEDSGEDLLAIYHSHTRSAAYPSSCRWPTAMPRTSGRSASAARRRRASRSPRSRSSSRDAVTAGGVPAPPSRRGRGV